MSATTLEDDFESKIPATSTNTIIPLGAALSYSSSTLPIVDMLLARMESSKPEALKSHHAAIRRVFRLLQHRA